MSFACKVSNCIQLRSKKCSLILKTAVHSFILGLAGLFSYVVKLLLLIRNIFFLILQILTQFFFAVRRLRSLCGCSFGIFRSILRLLCGGLGSLTVCLFTDICRKCCAYSGISFKLLFYRCALFKTAGGFFRTSRHIFDTAKRGGKPCLTASLSSSNGILESLHRALNRFVGGHSHRLSLGAVGRRDLGCIICSLHRCSNGRGLCALTLGIGRLGCRGLRLIQTKRLGDHIFGEHSCQSGLEHILLECLCACRILCENALDIIIHDLGN